MLRWYAVCAERQSEATVAAAIADRDWGDDPPLTRAFLPLEKRTTTHARYVRDATRPMIPGYLFAQFDTGDADEKGRIVGGDPWANIARIRGVVSILGMHMDASGLYRPTPIRQGEIEHLMRISERLLEPHEKKLFMPLSKLEKDVPVRIHLGILQNMTGVVIHDDRGRTLLRLDKSFGGKAITVPRDSVEDSRS